MDIITQLIVGGVALIGLIAAYFVKSGIDRRRGADNAKRKIEEAQREEQERQSKEFNEALDEGRFMSDSTSRDKLRRDTIPGDK